MVWQTVALSNFLHGALQNLIMLNFQRLFPPTLLEFCRCVIRLKGIFERIRCTMDITTHVTLPFWMTCTYISILYTHTFSENSAILLKPSFLWLMITSFNSIKPLTNEYLSWHDYWNLQRTFSNAVEFILIEQYKIINKKVFFFFFSNDHMID